MAPRGRRRAGTETVFFRHFDPRVLGALMPVLDAAQFSRVLGPAAEIAFLATDHGGVRRVLADATFPPAPPGLLTLRGEQIEALNGRRLAASHRRIAACLAELQPELSARIGDEAMLAMSRPAIGNLYSGPCLKGQGGFQPLRTNKGSS